MVLETPKDPEPKADRTGSRSCESSAQAGDKGPSATQT